MYGVRPFPPSSLAMKTHQQKHMYKKCVYSYGDYFRRHRGFFAVVLTGSTPFSRQPGQAGTIQLTAREEILRERNKEDGPPVMIAQKEGEVGTKCGGGGATKGVRGRGGANSNDWRESLAFCLLCAGT